MPSVTGQVFIVLSLQGLLMLETYDNLHNCVAPVVLVSVH